MGDIQNNFNELLNRSGEVAVVVNEAGNDYTSLEFRQLVKENYTLYQSFTGHKIYVSPNRFVEMQSEAKGISTSFVN